MTALLNCPFFKSFCPIDSFITVRHFELFKIYYRAVCLNVCLSPIPDKLCERAVQGQQQGMGSPGVHRGFFGSGSSCFWQDWRPHPGP